MDASFAISYNEALTPKPAFTSPVVSHVFPLRILSLPFLLQKTLELYGVKNMQEEKKKATRTDGLDGEVEAELRRQGSLGCSTQGHHPHAACQGCKTEDDEKGNWSTREMQQSREEMRDLDLRSKHTRIVSRSI